MNDEQFYRYFEIDPVCVLSECSYENLSRTGIEYGTDVCDYVDQENFKCKDCSLSTPTIDWWPEITSEVYLRLVLAIWTKDLEKYYLDYYTDVHLQIKKHAIKMAESNDLIKLKIQQILTVHCSEYVRQ